MRLGKSFYKFLTFKEIRNFFNTFHTLTFSTTKNNYFKNKDGIKSVKKIFFVLKLQITLQ
ncbi:hypothetical protein C1645_751997 [Glomus cerebriforme]|uniref:HSF-type DNA-binding domain-containing protein n=1 Tax=Glomus cerebriforme TaxID=658196 RepID=A0A397TL17_9GLOM|nr:hypothetical protein C1645_751997 [Glomus cerebriforme]